MEILNVIGEQRQTCAQVIVLLKGRARGDQRLHLSVENRRKGFGQVAGALLVLEYTCQARLTGPAPPGSHRDLHGTGGVRDSQLIEVRQTDRARCHRAAG